MAGQLIEAHGLRDIEATLAAHAPALKRPKAQVPTFYELTSGNTC
jgi:hypothetical protein